MCEAAGLAIAASAAAAEAQVAEAARLARLREPCPAAFTAPGPRELPAHGRLRPRLVGTEAHHRYVAWLRRDFREAGLRLWPRERLDITRWEAGRRELRVLDGPDAGPVKVAAYYVRSQETSLAGITAPLSYGGTVSTGGPAGGGLPGAAGSIVVVDLTAPAPLTAGIFLPQSTFRYWPGHDDADWLATDYTRAWIAPGLRGAPGAL